MPVLQVPFEVSVVMIEPIQVPVFTRRLAHPAAFLALLGEYVEGGTFPLELFGDRLEIEI